MIFTYQLAVVVKEVPQNSDGVRVSTSTVEGLQGHGVTLDHIHSRLGLGRYTWRQNKEEEKQHISTYCAMNVG